MLNTSDNIEMTTAKDINLSAYNMAVTLSGSKTITVNGSELQTVTGRRRAIMSAPEDQPLQHDAESDCGTTRRGSPCRWRSSMKLSLELAINTGLQTKICIGVK